jgi:hypothetical protein
MSQIDHEHTTSIVCPYCGHENSDSWEYQEDEDDVDCGSCDKSFSLAVHHSTTYTTSRKPCAEAHRFGAAHASRFTAEEYARIASGSRVLEPRGAHALWVRRCVDCEHEEFARTEYDGMCPWPAVSFLACIGDGCGDEDTGDIDQTTGLCGMCSRSGA